MKKKLIGLTATALLAVAFATPTNAFAATEFGDNCVGNELTESEPVTFFAFTAFGNPLSLTAPSSGVITKWKSSSAVPIGVPLGFKVLRQNSPTTVLIVGESNGSVTPGTSTFDTRIPVQQGDRLGLFGPEPLGVLFCISPGPENALAGFIGGGGGVGSTNPFIPITAEARFPVAAIIEPDADNDGFGDETQDLCPQLAAFQTACPVVTLDASGNARRGSATVLITATSQAPVTVAGTVKLGKGKTAKLKGGTQVVAPGTIAKFTLFFPKSVKERLKALSRKQSLKLSIVASATDLVGRVSSDSLVLKLKGQKKPPRKRGKGKAKG